MDVVIEPHHLGISKNKLYLRFHLSFQYKVLACQRRNRCAARLHYAGLHFVFALSDLVVLLYYNKQQPAEIFTLSMCPFFQVCQHVIMPGPFILKLRRSY